MGEYRKSIDVYERLKKNKEIDSDRLADIELFIQCCKFYLGENIDCKTVESYNGKHQPMANRLKIYCELKNHTGDSLDDIKKQLSSVIILIIFLCQFLKFCLLILFLFEVN